MWQSWRGVCSLAGCQKKETELVIIGAFCAILLCIEEETDYHSNHHKTDLTGLERNCS